MAQRTEPAVQRDPQTATPPVLPYARHVDQRTVVLDDLRILYLPMPKAGCTTVLWLLAELTGLPVETFDRSTWPGVAPAMVIHDMKMWGEGRRLADFEGDERTRVLTEPGWFRFSHVRDPAPRIWSAWQSKLLLREPRFLATFGDEPWFPRLPADPAHIVEDFRRFVTAVAAGEAEDVHWAVQHDLVDQLPLGHVGRLEQLSATLELLRTHLGMPELPAAQGRENRTPLPMPPGAYDEAAAAALHDHYRADFENYHYDRVQPATDDGANAEWAKQVAPLLPILRDSIDKHARIGQLQRIARQADALEKRLEAADVRNMGRSRTAELKNLEGRPEFFVRWGWSKGRPEPGFTAVVRAKNEARALPWVLPPLLRAVRSVIVVDNGSTDGTADVARRVAMKEGASDRLDVRSYPFAVARCGEEHLSTNDLSVHSLAYFYNWSFSHVRTAYSLKWDADMVLTDAAAGLLHDLGWQLEAAQTVVKIPRYPLYVADERHAFVDVGLRNCEPWAWPNRPGYSFVKAMEWEQPLWPEDLPTLVLPEWLCLELKFLDADEFDHWSDTNFEATARTRRKLREWEVFRALAEGGEPPRDVIAVEGPPDRHVIDYVRSTWLPARASEWADDRGLLAGLLP